MSRNVTVSTWAYSERTSCSTTQKPVWRGTGGNGSGDAPRNIAIFVDSIATITSTMKGMLMNRVNKPNSSSTPR